MSLVDHARVGFIGAWRLAAGRPDWRECFDLSADGFFKSFYAVAITFPCFAFIFLASRPAVTEIGQRLEPGFQQVAAGPAFVIVSIAFFLDWAFAILALAGLTRLLKIDARFAQSVIVYNWTRPLIVAAGVASAIIFSIGLTSANQFMLMQVGVLAWAVYVTVRALRAALEVRFATAAAVTAALFLLTLIVEQVVASFLAPAPAPAGVAA